MLYRREHKIIEIGDNLEFFAHIHLKFSNSVLGPLEKFFSLTFLASLGYKG